MRKVARRVLLGLVGLLYLVSIPWYRGDGAAVQVWLGLPDWVAVALVAYALAAALNAAAWWLADVEDPPPGAGEGPG
jgi:hypothetical protein